MNDYEYTEALIARYKVLQNPGEDGLTTDEAEELLTISMILGKRGFTLTDDESDWMPPLTPDEA
jgi:hypothetical protein